MNQALKLAAFPLLITAAHAGNYTAEDATYVTSSRNPDVVRYVVCLANAVEATPKRMSINESLNVAQSKCAKLAAKVPNSSGEPNTEEIVLQIMECGFRPGDAGDMDCE